MNKQKELEKLEKKIKKIYDEKISHLDIQKRKLKKEIEKQESSELIGKTFIYKDNSFSCPSKRSDYWDVYLKVIGYIDGGVLVLTIEKNAHGNIQIETQERYGNHLMGYVPCSEAMFEKYFKKYSGELLKFKEKRGSKK